MAEVIRRRCDDVPGFDVLGADSLVLAPLVVGVVARVMGAGAVPIGESTVEVIHRPTGTAFAMPSGVARSSSSGSSGASGISEWKSRSRRFTGSVSTGFVSSVRGGGRGRAVRLLVVRLLSDRVSGFVSGRHGVFGVLFPRGSGFPRCTGSIRARLGGASGWIGVPSRDGSIRRLGKGSGMSSGGEGCSGSFVVVLAWS